METVIRGKGLTIKIEPDTAPDDFTLRSPERGFLGRVYLLVEGTSVEERRAIAAAVRTIADEIEPGWSGGPARCLLCLEEIEGTTDARSEWGLHTNCHEAE